MLKSLISGGDYYVHKYMFVCKPYSFFRLHVFWSKCDLLNEKDIILCHENDNGALSEYEGACDPYQ